MIDEKTIASFFGNDASMLRGYVTVFIRESPALVNEMDEALYSGNYTSLAVHAHTLKTQIKYFGYPDLVAQLEEMEQLSQKQVSQALLMPLLSDFNREFQEAYKALSAILRL